MQMTSDPVMSNDHQPFSNLALILNSPEPVLICRHHECGYALQPAIKRVHSHLWEKHGITKDERRGLTAYLRSAHLVDPRTLSPREDGSEPHPDLARHLGFVCRSCGERRTSLKLIDQHIRDHHGAEYLRHARNLYQLRDKAYLQSWVQEGSRQYWIIRGDASLESSDDSPSTQGSAEASAHLSAVCESEQARIAEVQNSLSRTTDGNEQRNITQITPWMRRTQWFDTYRGARRDVLIKMTTFPSYESRRWGLRLGVVDGAEIRTEAFVERRLDVLSAAIDCLFDRCEETYHHTGRPILCWLYSQHPTLGSRRPFRLVGRLASRQKYRRIWKKFIFFLLRLYLMDDRHRRSALNIGLSSAQENAIRPVLESLGLSSNQETMGSGPLSDQRVAQGVSRTEWRINSSDTVAHVAEQNEDTMYKYDEDGDGDEDSTALHGVQSGDESENDNVDENEAGVESGQDDDDDGDDDEEELEEDDEYEDRENELEDQDIDGCKQAESSYVGEDALAASVLHLSIWFATERFIDGRPASSLLVYFSGILGFSPDGSTYRRARDFTSSLSALIHQLRLLFIEWALPYKSYPSLNKLARPTGDHLAALKPIRRRYTCLGCLTPLPEFISLRAYGRKIAHLDGPAFRVLWSDDGNTVSYEGGSLTMGQFRALGHSLIHQASKLRDELMYGWVPAVNLQEIRDDLNNSRQGFSFVDHPANDLAGAYLQLFKRACAAQQHSLFHDDRWDMPAVRRHLSLSDKYLRLLMCIAFCLGGQGPRAGELFTLECENGEATWRGPYIYNGYMMLINRYCKSRHITDKDFNVVRYLPHRAGLELFYYLVYIRRLDDMLRRRCQIGNGKSSMLFCTGSRAWTANDLTRAMREFTKPVWGHAVGSKLYRQLSVAVTEQHVKQILAPFDIYDDQSPNADINVVFAWQSGHRPKVRGENYGLDGAFPDSLQPSLLRVYEWASVRWHRYLGHQSRMETSKEGQGNDNILSQPVTSSQTRHFYAVDNIGHAYYDRSSLQAPHGIDQLNLTLIQDEFSSSTQPSRKVLQEIPQVRRGPFHSSHWTKQPQKGQKRGLETIEPSFHSSLADGSTGTRQHKRLKPIQPSFVGHQAQVLSSFIKPTKSSGDLASSGRLSTPSLSPNVPSATLAGSQVFPRQSNCPTVYFHDEHSVIICIPCGQRVGTGQTFINHFRQVHRLKGQELQDLIAFSQAVGAMQDASPLQNGSREVPYLPRLSGYECLGCGYLTTNRKELGRHCYKCSLVQDLCPKSRQVYVQTWSRGGRADYWTVQS